MAGPPITGSAPYQPPPPYASPPPVFVPPGAGHPRDDPPWMAFDHQRPRPRWGIPDVLLGLLAGVVVSVIFAVVAAVLTGEAGTLADGSSSGAGATVIAGMVGQWVGMVGYLVFASKVKGQGTLRDDFGLRWNGWADIALGIGVGLGSIIAIGIVISAVASMFGTDPGTNTDRILDSAGSDTGRYILVAFASFGAPVVEELYFRGLALRAFERRLGPALGIVMSTLVFAVLHYQSGTAGETVSLLAGIFVLGAIFAAVVRWRGTLVVSMTAHMTLNLTSSIAFLASR
jgi:membrane protease YdiL (CAAX protease family)